MRGGVDMFAGMFEEGAAVQKAGQRIAVAHLAISSIRSCAAHSRAMKAVHRLIPFEAVSSSFQCIDMVRLCMAAAASSVRIALAPRLTARRKWKKATRTMVKPKARSQPDRPFQRRNNHGTCDR